MTLPTPRMAPLGMGRTFQNLIFQNLIFQSMSLFPTTTVIEVVLGDVGRTGCLPRGG